MNTKAKNKLNTIWLDQHPHSLHVHLTAEKKAKNIKMRQVLYIQQLITNNQYAVILLMYPPRYSHPDICISAPTFSSSDDHPCLTL